MTYSIVAYDPESGQLGVAVASGSVAVGSRVPWARAGVAAVATQAYTNPALGALILKLVADGLSAREALSKALSMDPEAEKRQVAVVDAYGRVACYTGSLCPDEKAMAADEDSHVVVIGNLLASRDVVSAALRAYIEKESCLAERLLAALEAGHAAGGDARGDRSAALLVVGETMWSPYYDKVVDLRVDYSLDPVGDLRRLYERLRC